MSTEHAGTRHPGALVRKRRRWPPANASEPIGLTRFARVLQWEPRTWHKAATVRWADDVKQ